MVNDARMGTFAPGASAAVLENGLRVVTVALPHLHTTTLALYIKVGSRYESAAENGLSHFVEHMLFRGTERYPSSLALNLAFESLGGSLQAETGRDYSLYSIALEPDGAAEGIALLGELVRQPRFSEIERERALILEELSEDYDEAGSELCGDDIARGLLYPGHPLGQRIIGPRENVERFGEADVRAHFSRHYTAHNMLLCAAGPIDAEDIVDAARRELSGLAAGERLETCAPAPLFTGPAYKYVSDPGAQTSLHIGFRALPEADPDHVASLALLRIIDDGMSARLHYRLCDQRGLAYSLSAGLDSFHDAAVLDVSGQTTHPKVSTLTEAVLALCGELRDERVPGDELAKVKRRYRRDVLALADDPGAMAGWFGGGALYIDPPALADRIAAMEALDAEDIRRAAQRIFCREHLAVVAVGRLSRARQGELRQTVTAWS